MRRGGERGQRACHLSDAAATCCHAPLTSCPSRLNATALTLPPPASCEPRDPQITASACGQAESVLRDVATLASAISQSNQVTEEPALSPRKLARQLAFALASFKASLAFCWRGLQLMCRDVGEVAMLALKLWQQGLGKEDILLVKRTLTDVVCLATAPASHRLPPTSSMALVSGLGAGMSGPRLLCWAIIIASAPGARACPGLDPARDNPQTRRAR